jgi:hypothetical protein
MIKTYHLIALHFVNDFLSVVAARVVHVRGQFDRVFSPAKILCPPLRIRQPKANEVVLSECFIRVKSIDAYQALITKKNVIIASDV